MSNAIVPANQNVKQLATFLEAEAVRKKIRLAIPSGTELTEDRLIYQALLLANNNPRIADCNQASVYTGIIQAADLGLELSGPLGQAYLVPRKIKGQWVATFQTGYRGLMTLAQRSGRVSNFQLRKVYKTEVDHGKFEVEYGDYPRLRHEPVLFSTDDTDPQEEVVAYYCLINFVDGGKDFEVMTFKQGIKHRDRFAATKDFGPWYDMTHGFHEMVLKTVARKVCKRAPVSVKLVKAAVLDEYHEANIVDSRLLPPVENSRTLELAAALAPAPSLADDDHDDVTDYSQTVG